MLTDDIGQPVRPDELGAGLINARKAIAAVDPSLPALPPTLSVTPSSLAFGDIGTTAQVFVTNAGGGALTITGVRRRLRRPSSGFRRRRHPSTPTTAWASIR